LDARGVICGVFLVEAFFTDAPSRATAAADDRTLNEEAAGCKAADAGRVAAGARDFTAGTEAAGAAAADLDVLGSRGTAGALLIWVCVVLPKYAFVNRYECREDSLVMCHHYYVVVFVSSLMTSQFRTVLESKSSVGTSDKPRNSSEETEIEKGKGSGKCAHKRVERVCLKHSLAWRIFGGGGRRNTPSIFK
jgi:hypothetical protein